MAVQVADYQVARPEIRPKLTQSGVPEGAKLSILMCSFPWPND